MRAMAFVTGFLLLVLVPVDGNVGNPFQDNSFTQEEITHLWSTLDTKPAPIYRCQGWYGGNKLAIPKATDCSMPSKHDENKVVSLTLYLPDIGRQTVTGYECYSVKEIGWISRSFFNSRTKDSWLEYSTVSQSACLKMVTIRRSPDGHEMNSAENGVVGTRNELKIESYWNCNETGSVTNYYFRELSISVYDLDKSIITSTDTKRPCMYNDTYCPTTLGILIWKTWEIKTCRLTEVGKSTCIYSNSSDHSRVTCPELQLSLHSISEVDMCSLKFGASDQGYYFLQDEPGLINERINLSDEVSEIISRPSERVRRDTNTQDAFVNGKLSYLYDMMKDNLEINFQKIHHDICYSNKLLWTFLTMVAKRGYPSLLVQVLYGDPSLRASFSGDALSVWQCTPIYTYKFLSRGACYYEMPVLYVYNGKQHTSYVMPLSHALTDEPVKLAEPCPEFYYDAQNYTLHVTDDGPKLVNLPLLPQPDMGSTKMNIPNISFKSTSGIDIDSFSDFMHTMTLINEMRTRIEIFRNLETKMTEIEGSILPLKTFSAVVTGGFSTIFSKLSSFTYIIICVIIIVIGVVLSCFGGPFIMFSYFKFVFYFLFVLVKVICLPFKTALIVIKSALEQHIKQKKHEEIEEPTSVISGDGGEYEKPVRKRFAPTAPSFPPIPPKLKIVKH